MRRKIAGIAMAATAALGAGAGFAPSAFAQDQSRAERMDERLDDLVQDGVITEERARELRDRLAERTVRIEEKRIEREAQVQELADTLGLSVDELRAARRDGTPLADLAESAGVDIQVIIDQLVAHATEHVNHAREQGHITQAQADDRIAELTERITARVNGDSVDRVDRPFESRFGTRSEFRAELRDRIFSGRFGGPGRFGPNAEQPPLEAD